MPDACDEWRPIPGGPVSVVIPPPLLPPRRGAALACPAPRPPAPSPPSRPGRHPPLPLEVRLDALGAVVLDGLSYRRAARMVGICKTEVGDSLDLLLGELAALGLCQPDGTFVATLQNLRERLAEMTEVGEAVCVDGLATRVQRPTAICCGVTVAGPGAAMSTSCWRSRACVRPWTPPASPPWSTGDSEDGQGPHALARADRGPTHQRPGHAGRTRPQPPPAGLRALVKQAIGHLANALVDNTVSRSVPRRR